MSRRIMQLYNNYYRTVLYEMELMRKMIGYVMYKLKHANKFSRYKTVQLLQMLGSLCACKGIPVQQNQSEEGPDRGQGYMV